MKLVIDIPEDVFEFYKKQATEKNSLPTAVYFIANGIPLPKGHGDLIDRDVAYDVYHNANLSWNGSGLLKYIPTVIPADKSEVD